MEPRTISLKKVVEKLLQECFHVYFPVSERPVREGRTKTWSQGQMMSQGAIEGANK